MNVSESETAARPTADAEFVKRLTELVEKNGLSELRYEEESLRVTLRTGAYRPALAPQIIGAMPALVPGAGSADTIPSDDTFDAGTDRDEENTDAQIRIEAPLMGVFYRAAKPEDPPFVEVGDTVEVGQAVGLIEAMKVFSEVLSEAAGVVRAIPLKNGTLVQPGDALVLLEAQP